MRWFRSFKSVTCFWDDLFFRNMFKTSTTETSYLIKEGKVNMLFKRSISFIHNSYTLITWLINRRNLFNLTSNMFMRPWLKLLFSLQKASVQNGTSSEQCGVAIDFQQLSESEIGQILAMIRQQIGFAKFYSKQSAKISDSFFRWVITCFGKFEMKRYWKSF